MQKSKLALLLSSFLMTGLAYAEETSQTTKNNDFVETLETIVVSATPFSQQIGTQTITEEDIKRQPSTNTIITGLLRNNMNVRFSNQSNLSNDAGEIRPDEVSFHGEKFYNNNYILDGMSNNDNTNPVSSAKRNGGEYSASITQLPAGGTQSFWVDTSILKNVEAFDSNISAKYGNFTGGVINAELKDPSFEKWNTGKVYYRTTRDSWASFHVDDEKVFKKAEQLDDQPEYTKHQYGAVINQKINDKASMIFSYDRTTSDIAFYHGNIKNRQADGTFSPQRLSNIQKRKNETFLWKGIYLPDNGDIWRTTIMYAPNKATLYAKNVKDGRYTTEGGGIQVNMDWEKQFQSLKMKSYVGYKYTHNIVEYDQDNYARYVTSKNIPWKSTNNDSMYGGTGSHETEKGILTLKQDYELTEFDLANTQHKFEFGWAADFAKAAYNRDNNNSQYFYVQSPKVICNGDPNCINGDQYASSKQTLVKRSVTVNDNMYAAYIQDRMKWKNLEFAAGLRIDHNRFFGKTNLAHRLSSSYDVFGDQSTRIFGGYNRYYAGSMLARKLSQGIGTAERSSRKINADGTLGEWTQSRSYIPTRYNTSELNVPYSDEYSFGISQRMLGSDWTAKWVHRNSRDQLTQTHQVYNGASYTVLKNGGWGRNDQFSLSIKPMESWKTKYADIGWGLGVSFNRNRTNSSYYDKEEDLTKTKAIYNDKLVDTKKLSANDFNDPTKLYASLNTYFPSLRLHWDQSFSYNKKYTYMRVDPDNATTVCSGSSTIAKYRAACGSYGQNDPKEVQIYTDDQNGGKLLVDWRFSYKQPIYQNQFIELTLDINNVLNTKALASTASGTPVYKMGRNFWLGASYNW